TEELDELLNQIEADISAQRLTNPVGNNALERIDAFRSQAPFDFRITPLIFKFGESYVALANKAIAEKKYGQAQGYLDIAWQVSALAPGLEAAQEKNDTLSDGKTNTKRVAAKAPSTTELKEQKALAAAAIAEKKRLDNDRINKVRADKQAKADTAVKAAASKKVKQEAERKRRLANAELEKQKEKSQKENLQRQLAAAKSEKSRLQSLAQQKNKSSAIVNAQIKTQDMRSVAPIRIAEETPIGNGVETSTAIASYPLPQDKISNRDRGISQDLVPICKAILDKDASIVLHTDSKGDYRWLTVRLTLCIRRLDPSFRLRHSFDKKMTSESFITLHPARSTALLRDM
ncbi:MAG: colicin import membrane protein, partial [Oleispira sp.]